MKYDILIIGSSGLQGRIVAKDLLDSGYKIFCADLYREGSEKNLTEYPGTPFEFIDLRDYDEAGELIKKVSPGVVINCAEGDWNHDVFRICLEAGCNVVDLGSNIAMTKAQLDMDSKFKKAGLIGITGCGSTPGINNIMFAHAVRFFKEIDTIELGFAWDSNVKKFVVPFSIESIVDELTEPALVLEDGKWIEKNPLESEVVLEFREIGAEKCYLVRHPEAYTFFQYFKNHGLKNIRFYGGFPDHSLEIIKRLTELGLGRKDLLTFENIEIRPVDATSRILTRLPRPENYSEKENLWVEISGKDKEDNIRLMRMECIVFTLPGWLEHGCNIDTGFPASIIAQMVFDGRIKQKGSFSPEAVVSPAEFFAELKKKGLTVYQDGQALNN